MIGVVAGIGLAAAISSHRSGIWRESSALAVLTVVTISFFSLDSAGGSGYLGAFLAGLIVGNMEHLGLAMHSQHEQEMRLFAFNIADLATLFVFVVLGANIPFERAGRQPAAGARGARDAAARGPPADRARLRAARPRGGAGPGSELAFLCWTRETGVVPAALVGVLAGLGVPDGDALRQRGGAGDHRSTLLLRRCRRRWLAGRLGLLGRPTGIPLAAAIGKPP